MFCFDTGTKEMVPADIVMVFILIRNSLLKEKNNHCKYEKFSLSCSNY